MSSNSSSIPHVYRQTISEETAAAFSAAKLAKSLIAEARADVSPEAKMKRRRLFYRAVYGEFMGTFLIFTIAFCMSATQITLGFSDSSPLICMFMNSILSGFFAISFIFMFSSISGSHFNCGITFAAWVVKKTSNRKLAGFIAAQLTASLLATCMIGVIFPDPVNIFNRLAIVPPLSMDSSADYFRVFMMEFVLNFLLAYVAFVTAYENSEEQKKNSMSIQTVALTKGLTLFSTSPQDRTGFAPFILGFILAVMPTMGAAVSGPAINVARIFGPAVCSGKWSYVWLYWLAQLSGSALGSIFVSKFHTLGRTEEESGAIDVSASTLIKKAELAIKNSMQGTEMKPMRSNHADSVTANIQDNPAVTAHSLGQTVGSLKHYTINSSDWTGTLRPIVEARN